MKGIFKHIGVFICMLLVLWAALMAAAAVPNESIQANMERSALTYKEKDAYQFYSPRLNDIEDNYADAILLNVAWNMGEGDALTASLDSKYYDGEEYGENYGFYLTVTGQGVEPNVDYSRYWHGTAIPIRLLHLVTDVQGIKMIGFAAVILFTAITSMFLARYKKTRLAIALIISLICVKIWNVRLSMEYQPTFIIGLALCPLYLYFERRDENKLTLLSVAGGVLTAFFDFLTTETVVIMLPLILVTAVRSLENRLGSFKDGLRLAVKCILCWGLAYAGTFIAKWTLATIVTGENKFYEAVFSAGERFGGSVLGEGPDSLLLRIPGAVIANLTTLYGGTARVDILRVILGLVLSAAVILSVMYVFKRKTVDRDAVRLLLILGAVCILRYMVLSNHSYLHEFFTYRALCTTLLAVLSIAALSTTFKKGGV